MTLLELIKSLKIRISKSWTIFFGISILVVFAVGAIVLFLKVEKDSLKPGESIKHLLINQEPQQAQAGVESPCLGPGLYSVYNNQIVYQSKGTTLCKEVEGGYDTTTFEVLDYGFARDKDKVFLDGKVIKDVDLDTFTVLAPRFGKDHRSGFFNWDAIPQSDGKAFEIYTKLNEVSGEFFSRDAQHVFRGMHMISGADPDSFQLLDTITTSTGCGLFFRDKSNVFMEGETIEGADPSTFRFIGQAVIIPVLYDQFCITADKNHVYSGGVKISNLDPYSIKILGIYTKDANAVYLNINEKQIKSADPKTFELIDRMNLAVAKDKNSVYKCGEVVMPNRAGFELLGGYYGRAGSVVYYQGQIIPGADAKSFTAFHNEILDCESLSGGYAVDKNYVYYDGKIIPGADVKTFKLSDTELGVAYDKNGEYQGGEKLVTGFMKCSVDPADLPGGFSGWKLKLGSLGSDTSVSLFEFCVLPNQDKLIAYKTDPVIEEKSLLWFDSKNQLIKTTKFSCVNEGTVLPQSMYRVNESVVTLQCLSNTDACTHRSFFDLNLKDWKTTDASITKQENVWFDCGYRG